MWTTIIFVLIIILIIYWKGLNAVWIRLTIGLAAGSIIYVVFFMHGDIFSLTNLARSMGIGIFISFLFETIEQISRIKKK